jgi:hypothetical protein
MGSMGWTKTGLSHSVLESNGRCYSCFLHALSNTWTFNNWTKNPSRNSRTMNICFLLLLLFCCLVRIGEKSTLVPPEAAAPLAAAAAAAAAPAAAA